MALSDQLTELAARAKEAEDRAAAARDKSKAGLQADVETARASSQERAKKLRESADANKNKLSVWWYDLQHTWNEHVAKIRDDIDSKRAEHDVDRAERRAEHRADDATFAVDFAYSAIEEAEYAVLDAELARKEADELVAA
jgi:vacuolar-type H+-ATPase subunit I/STV1